MMMGVDMRQLKQRYIASLILPGQVNRFIFMIM